jgi:hypothetical protein
MRIWRPRFSVRTLAIFVTLVCVYFAAWGTTKRYASLRVATCTDGIMETGSSFPLVIWKNEVEARQLANGFTILRPRRFYLWVFGPEFKLPFELEWVPNILPSPSNRR